jgi:hypothetical protein
MYVWKHVVYFPLFSVINGFISYVLFFVISFLWNTVERLALWLCIWYISFFWLSVAALRFVVFFSPSEQMTSQFTIQNHLSLWRFLMCSWESIIKIKLSCFFPPSCSCFLILFLCALLRIYFLSFFSFGIRNVWPMFLDVGLTSSGAVVEAPLWEGGWWCTVTKALL